MAISTVITFEGSPDDLVWKYSGEEFNTTSQLLVDETHQALLVVNGQAADLFGPGRHTLDVPNIPFLKRIINIPTGGVSPFRCKIFYISQVHQMDMLWGTRGAITLNDPLYDIFLHVMLHGSMSFSVADSRKLLIKLVGFRSRYTAKEMVENFKGLVSSHVKDAISKIMINGMLSYFMINANLFDISEAVKGRLDTIFDEYGIRIEYFNIETIEVPPEDYEAVTKSKERRSGRLIEGYTWQEERQMMIAEKFAGNEGSMGSFGGMIGGMMMGGAMSGSIADIAKQALNAAGVTNPPQNTAGTDKPWNAPVGGFDVKDFLQNGGGMKSQPQAPVQPQSPAQPVGNPFQQIIAQPTQPSPVQPSAGSSFCPECGTAIPAGSKFCPGCGKKQETDSVCPNCGSKIVPGSKFCAQCGTKLS